MIDRLAGYERFWRFPGPQWLDHLRRQLALEYVRLDGAAELLRAGRRLVSTTFVVPYPPGFPVLIPGQRVSPVIVDFLRGLDVKEIHGYRAGLGLPVFTEEALARRAPQGPAAVDGGRP